MRFGVSTSIFVVSLFASLSLTGCGNAALRAAESGDQARLRAEIASKHEKGKLSNGEARDLARAVAEREITMAKDEASALARLQDTRACADALDDALAERMKKHDGAGAEAALSRLEDRQISEGTARDYLDDADDRWRAVGARTLKREKDRGRRQQAMVDPSPRIRRSAIRASAEARDVTDIDLLLETARVDPDLLLRNEAIRAVSGILRTTNDRGRAADVALRLRDLWTSGDDAVREDIAVAWALSPVLENGGREALRVTIAEGHGSGAIAAAGVVLRTASGDKDLAPSASALLARTISDGSRRDRMHALAVARTEGIELDAMRKLAKEEDKDARVPVLARLLDSKPDRDAALKELESIAAYGTKRNDKDAKGTALDERAREQAVRARHALAAAGDVRVQAWIEEDLAAAEPHRRTSAAAALAALGRPARAAPLLADADASVRTRAACTMIVASRR